MSREQGVSRLALIVISIVVGVLIFVGWNVLPFYYYHQELLGLAEFQAKKAAILSDRKIRQNLTYRIKELGLPLDDESDLQINRFSGKIIIHYEYEEVFWVNLGEWGEHELWVFPFVVHAESRVPDSRR